MKQLWRKVMSDKVERPPNYWNWIEPTYLNIDWSKNNHIATPAIEITRDEFDLLRDHCIYGLRGINYDNTIRLPDAPEGERLGQDGNSWNIHYYFYPFCAIAVADCFFWREKDYEEDSFRKGLGDFLPDNNYERYTSGYARRYFRIGCEHKWIELSQAESKKRGISHYGNCWHVNYCDECGEVWTYDSSG